MRKRSLRELSRNYYTAFRRDCYFHRKGVMRHMAAKKCPHKVHGLCGERRKHAASELSCSTRKRTMRSRFRRRQAYCLYRRRPLGRRYPNACRGEPRTPERKRENTVGMMRPQKERTQQRPITKERWSPCGSVKGTTPRSKRKQLAPT